LSQLKRAAEGVWGKLLRIQLRCRFLNQLERIEEQLVIIQWRRGFLSQRGRVEGIWGQGLVIQWRGGLGGRLGRAERGQWRGSGEGRSEIMGQIEGGWGGWGVSGCAPSAAHFNSFNSYTLRLPGAGCLLLRHSSGYYTIYDFEIKEMFGDYQTFFACRRSRSFGKNEE